MEETYMCEYCGTEIDWNGSDEQKGVIWECEETGCGRIFCVDCFYERQGSGVFYEMANIDYGDDVIRCPDCYAKVYMV